MWKEALTAARDIPINNSGALDLCQHCWTEQNDLYEFAGSSSSSRALLNENPDFRNDSGRSIMTYPTLSKLTQSGLLSVHTYSNRTKLLHDDRNWHSFAYEPFDESCSDPSCHSSLYGSLLAAFQDLGLLWA